MNSSGCTLAAEVAKILDEAKIPHFLWGGLAIALAGASNDTQEIEYIIPDEHLNTARETLYDAGFRLCGNSSCDRLRIDVLWARPLPDVHFHLEGIDPCERYTELSLYTKSSTVWWLPDLTISPPPDNDPHFMLSTDPRLPPYHPYGGTGPWTDLYPIKILNPSTLTEATLMLNVRDIDQPNCLQNTWSQWLVFFCEDREYPETNVIKTVSPRFQAIWHRYNYITVGGGGENAWNMIRRMRREMVASGELPASPDYDVEEATRARYSRCHVDVDEVAFIRL